tara:strand:- start:667 stop:867 length:201 start_codon:yes stop_codon:yes gene_type:complete
MTFHEIMTALSKMYSSYDAACWLKRPRKVLEGKSPADLMKEGTFPPVTTLLQKEPKYKKICAKIHK